MEPYSSATHNIQDKKHPRKVKLKETRNTFLYFHVSMLMIYQELALMMRWSLSLKLCKQSLKLGVVSVIRLVSVLVRRLCGLIS